MGQKKTKVLTRDIIRKLKRTGVCQQVADGNGLYIQVRVSGNKGFISRYVCPFDFKQTIVSIGDFPEVTLTKARNANRRIQMMVENGINPKDYRDLFFDGDINSIGAFRYRQNMNDLLYTRKFL